MKRSLVLALVVVIVILVLAWTACRPPEPRPSILLISVDTLRQDHVSAYGYSRPTTPTLDRLAAEGALLVHAVSPTSWTLPAHVSALTGLTPSAHRTERDRDRIPDGVVTLAEVLKEAGYATAGFVSHVYMDGSYGFDRGFDTYVTSPEQRAERVTDQALEWIEGTGGRPFFLFLHYFDPHLDYAPPEPYVRQFGGDGLDPAHGTLEFIRQFESPSVALPHEVATTAVALYDGEIRYTDDQIGRLVDSLVERSRLDDTIVAVFSDHGEEFKEHDSFGHGRTLYAEIARVPLIVRFPSRTRNGTRLEQPAVITDLPAILSALAGIEPPSQFLGDGGPTAVLEALAAGDQPDAADRSLVLETTRDGPKRFAAMGRDYKYVAPGRWVRISRGGTNPNDVAQEWVAIPEALYRLSDDPGESVNRIFDHEPAGADALARLRGVVHEHIRFQARGVRLVCSSPPGEGATFVGMARFEESVLDEPFGFNLGPEDRIVPLRRRAMSLRASEYSVEIRVDGEEKGVVLVPAEGASRAAVTLLRGGARYVDAVVPLPEPGSTLPLGNAGSGASCRLEGGPTGPASGGEVTLTDAQREKLRSLGYIQ